MDTGGAAKVTMRELDLTTTVPSFPGVYGGVVVDTMRGRLTPSLSTSETQFLKNFTIGDSIPVGCDLAHYSALAFLQKSNKLWVVRPQRSGAKYASSVLTTVAETPTKQATGGVTDPETYIFEANDLMLIAALDPGVWGNRLKYAIVKNADSKLFTLKVYLDNLEVESFQCSRSESYMDGFNRTTYVEQVVRASAYITVVDNPLVPEATLPAVTATPVALSLGADGAVVTPADRIKAVQKLRNKNSYMVTLLLSGGCADVPYQKELIAIAEYRQDCVAILNVPFEEENSSDYLNAIVTWRKETLNANTSYAALYTPHVKVYDRFNARDIWVSPDGYVGAAISNAAVQQEIWYPVAGYRRGVLPVNDTLRRFEDGEMDLLATEGINPIRFSPGRGIVIWGQKSLLSRPSRLSKLHVRFMLIVIKPAIAEALEDYQFEFNDVANRQLVTAMVESYLKGIKGRNGIEDFKVKCDEENNTPDDIDNDRMNLVVFVKAKGVAEYIDYLTVITPSGLNFANAAELI